MKLNVFVNEVKVGELFEQPGLNVTPDLVFQYVQGAPDDQFVSQSMPVREEPYIATRLHPYFDMLLPEGERRTAINQMGKITRTDDLGILSLVGSNTIGRVKVSPNSVPDGPSSFNYHDFLTCQSGRDFFDRLLNESGYRHGVAGVQPKVLEHDDRQRTFLSGTHIIKSYTDDFPFLTINEAICLETAGAAGIVVPEFDLSADGQLLAVKRFDLSANGTRLGVEEMVSLLGQYSHNKYEGCFENVTTFIEFAMGIEAGIESLEQFFKQLVFSVLTKNGDLHLKNIAFLYSDQQDIHLAPAYDLICTHAYMLDPPALALEEANYTKRWWGRDEMISFAERNYYLTSRQANSMINDVATSIVNNITLIDNYIECFPYFSHVGDAMKHAWSESLLAFDINIDSNTTNGPR